MNCRHCKALLSISFLDLGFSPPSNAYLNTLSSPETYFPLRVFVCSSCFLVQTEDYTKADALFDQNYAYFSSTSSSWLKHAQDYVSNITSSLQLNTESFVIEIASNDGYLLKNFVERKIPCLGIEPTRCTAEVAEKLGIPVVKEFFGHSLALEILKKWSHADLIIGNNVYAHVPDINDFTLGLKIILKPGGVITLEFPHLLELIKNIQFDTVYHEHFSYLSLSSVDRIFKSCGLRIWDVAQLGTHGGSLRIYGVHELDKRQTTKNVHSILQKEEEFGLNSCTIYSTFQEKVDVLKYDLISFLIEQKRNNKKVMGYGAAAKGNTFLNYAGIKSDLVSCIYDAALSKQEKWTPGAHIPICSPQRIPEDRPDFLLILPWNLDTEVAEEQSVIRSWGGQFVTAIPKLHIF